MMERVLAIVLPVFAVAAVGYLYARVRGERSRAELAALNALNLNLLAPLLCFTALAAKEFRLGEHVPLLIGAFIVIAVSGLLAWPVARLAGFDARTFVPPMMFNNCGNMGLPLAALAFGATGLGAMVAMFTVSQLLHFSLGVRIVSHGRIPWRQSLRLLASPLMIGTAAGLLLAIGQWHLPDWLFAPLKMLGDAGIVLMLFALGVRLIDVNLRAWPVGLAGAVVCPIAGLAGAWLADFLLGLDPNAWGRLVLFAVLPPAVLNFMVAEVYGQEPEKVASIVLLGNLAALIFVPLGLMLALR
ncbi:MAG: AEC family transporter [Sutterellaceae bacterium]|nr:AEC family transporter [Burkholderiaceae bacterium]MCX7901006.1 AEC family transporter [Burkholderiaceae bacterium]MDW8430368.1 AEC family transporter [Sutterellaceae bacterium]